MQGLMKNLLRSTVIGSYLYKQNIEIDSAYFHILFYKYLSSIKNPKSRLYYCIARYSTAARNTALAFSGHNIINIMSPKEVYYIFKKTQI